LSDCISAAVTVRADRSSDLSELKPDIRYDAAVTRPQTMMIVARLRSFRPHHWLFPPRPLFRDRLPPSEKGKPSIGRRRVVAAGLLLAGAALLTVMSWDASESASPGTDRIATLGPAAASAADTASMMQTTDGRAVADLHDDPAVSGHADTIATRIDPGCAEHAREKLMVGLTNYYLQRRLRPGASSDDAAETSSLTGVLAGPGDPAAMTPDTACRT